jgi:autotransporter-associated beta strand protein
MTNDIFALDVNTLQFNHSGILVGGELRVNSGISASAPENASVGIDLSPSLVLEGDVSISVDNTTGQPFYISCEVFLGSNNLSVAAADAASVVLGGNIVGTGNLLFTSGSSTLSPATSNIFNGSITVAGGTLSLAGAHGYTVPGPLFIGFGATVSMANHNQIASSSSVEIYSGGNLLMNGYTTTIANLAMTNFPGDAVACTVDTGGGVLGINGGITVWDDGLTVGPAIKGILSLNGFTPIFVGGIGGLEVFATLAGNGFSKAGEGYMNLRGTDTFSGGVEVDEGELGVFSSGAFGASSGVLLYGTGSLNLTAPIAGIPLTVEGSSQVTANTAGSLLKGSLSASWSGPILLQSSLVVQGGASLSGVISGPGGIEFSGPGPSTLGGTGANTYAGLTRVDQGSLTLNNLPFAYAVPNNLVIGPASATTPASVIFNNSALMGGTTVTVDANSSLNLVSNAETFSQLNLNDGGSVVGSGFLDFTGGATVSVGSLNPSGSHVSSSISGNIVLPQNDSPVTFNVNLYAISFPFDSRPELDVPAAISGANPNSHLAPTALIKTGLGQMQLGGNNNFTGPVNINGGTLIAAGATALGTPDNGTFISDGATLRITGPIAFPYSIADAIEMTGTGFGGTHGAIEVVGSSVYNLNGPIRLDGATTINVGTNSEIRLAGAVSSAPATTTPLTFVGGGEVSLQGTSGNSFSGDTFIKAGTLLLNKPDAVTAIPGNLFVGTADGSTVATGLNLNNYQIIASVVVYPNSTYNINNFQENVGYLQLWGNAAVTTGSGGYLSMPTGANVDVYASAISGPATISGVIEMDPVNHQFYVASNASLVISAAVNQYSTTASIEKTGPGVLELTGNNTFGGNVYVTDGTLIAASATALGTGSSTTSVSNNAALALDGGNSFTLQTLVLNSGNPAPLQSLTGSNTWSGPIGLYQPTGISVGTAGHLQVLNTVSGAGGLTKLGAGTLQFWGYGPNTYTGGTTVARGTLEAGRVNQVSIPGDVVVGDGTAKNTVTLQIDREQQFSAAANVTLRENGVLSLYPVGNVPMPTIGTLSGNGSLELGPTNASLTVNNSTFCKFDGPISLGGAFHKNGPARMQLISTTKNYFGTIFVDGGALQVDGFWEFSPVQVNAGKLMGNGFVGSIYMNAAGAVVEPGDSPGILNCGNLNPGSNGYGTLNVALNGPAPGTGYDQLNVTGTVNLTGLTLAGSLGFASSPGNSFTIINNDGADPVTGTFVGLPQNATVTIGWQQFSISYTGGTGNDVVLTQISSNAMPSCTPAPSGIVAWWPGAGNANDILGGNNGILQNGATFVPGVVGQGFFFDGVDDQVVVPGFCNLLPTNEITVEFWQKVNAAVSQFEFVPSVENPANIFDVSGPWADGKFYWEFGNILTSGQLSYTPTNSLIGTWQHFACVASQSGNYMKIYRNGVLEAQKTGMTPFVRTNLDLVLGGIAPDFYGGQLDELTIYNRELSPTEIQAIYNAGSLGKCLTQPVITSLQPSTNSVAMSWVSQPGMTYRVQSYTNFSAPIWTDASGDIIATNATTGTTMPATSPQQFYRLKLVQ